MKTWDEVVEGYRERWIKIFSQGVEGFSDQACREIVYALTPKTGKWMVGDAFPHNVYCSNCFATYAQEKWEVWADGTLPRNYCPNCGSYNGGDGDE